MRPMTKPIRVSQAQTAFDPKIPPVCSLASGAEVIFETSTRVFEELARGNLSDSRTRNYVSGPVWIEDAAPGDVLRVTVLEISISSAWALYLPGERPFPCPDRPFGAAELPIRDGQIELAPGVRAPLRPMIGCIGLAPSSGASSTFEPAYPWGGNLDLRELEPGAVLYLPVQTAGALLSIGDFHAAMGRGEPTWIGIEAAGEARVRVELCKGVPSISSPRLETADAITFVAVAAPPLTLEDAVASATEQARNYLITECRFSPTEALHVASALLDLHFGGPACAVVLATLPRSLARPRS